MANAGLGQLNAVQQGTVTRISEFTSEEKRKTIEDLIGLSYFDEKKSEAVKQLDEADRRLEIALAKMGEIKKRIDELEEERNQKLRHDILERELNQYKAIAAANKMKAVVGQKSDKEEKLRTISAEISKFDAQRMELRTQISELDSKKSKLMSEANEYSHSKAALDSEISSAMEKYEIDNSSISAMKKRISQIDARFPEINHELSEIDKARDNIDTEIDKIKISLDTITMKKNKVNEDLSLVDSERNDILNQQSEAAAKKSEIDNKIKDLTEQLNGAKLKLSKIQHEREELSTKIDLNSEKLGELESDVSKLSEYKIRLNSMRKNHQATITELKSRIKKLQTRKSKINNDMDELGLILEKSSKAATQYESKIKTVKGFMHEDYTVAKLKEDAEKLGIEGLVYEMISWDKQYDRSILAVSSDWIKAIVVKDFATLLGIAEFARSKKLPKLKIIPLDAIPNFKLTLPKNPDVLGVLSDYVKCDTSYSPLLKPSCLEILCLQKLANRLMMCLKKDTNL